MGTIKTVISEFEETFPPPTLSTNAPQLATAQSVSEPDPAPNRLRRAECNDLYPAVVVYLSDKLRVIECRNGLQWILQRRRSRCPNNWRGIKYCRTKEVLMRCVGTGDDATMEILRALPDLFPERPRRRRRGEAAAHYAQLNKVTEVSEDTEVSEVTEVTEVTDQCRPVPEPEQMWQ
jgi:hypothetical protein